MSTIHSPYSKYNVSLSLKIRLYIQLYPENLKTSSKIFFYNIPIKALVGSCLLRLNFDFWKFLDKQLFSKSTVILTMLILGSGPGGRDTPRIIEMSSPRKVWNFILANRQMYNSSSGTLKYTPPGAAEIPLGENASIQYCILKNTLLSLHRKRTILIL